MGWREILGASAPAPHSHNSHNSQNSPGSPGFANSANIAKACSAADDDHGKVVDFHIARAKAGAAAYRQWLESGGDGDSDKEACAAALAEAEA